MVEKNIIIGVSSVVSFLVATAVIITVIMIAPAALPKSAGEGELLLAQRGTRPSGEPRIVARSYDGFPWEGMADQDDVPPEVKCNEKNRCTIRLGEAEFSIKRVAVPERLVKASDEEKAVRLWMQAAFGASRDEIDDFVATYAGDYEQWVLDQMELEPTLLRPYFRERSNPRQGAANAIGGFYEPCESGSRWHNYAFNILDEGRYLVIDNSDVSNRYSLRTDSVLRGELTNYLGADWPGTGNPNITFNFPETRIICEVTGESVGGDVVLSSTDLVCNTDTNIIIPNPAISFTTPAPEITQMLATSDAQFETLQLNPDVIILEYLDADCADAIVGGVAYFGYEGKFYRFDPRLKLIRNTLDNPSEEETVGSTVCPSVTKNFINEPTCVRRPSCSPLKFSSADLALDDTTLKSWYDFNTRYVYYFTGLRLEDPYDVSFCSGTSRWLRTSGSCSSVTSLDATTLGTVTEALSSSTDTNPYVRDITLNGENCTSNAASIGSQVQIGGECFEHVHPDLYSVRDASYWTLNHDGNQAVMAQNRPNPISNWAQTGLQYLSYPVSHPMSRWDDRKQYLPLVGRYGDIIDFQELPTELQTLEMAQLANAIIQDSDDLGFETCGSSGEAKNIPTLGHRYQMQENFSPSSLRTRQLDYRYSFSSGKSMVWMNTVLTAKDQLRHRVSWALAQILTMSSEGLGMESDIEPWTNYYDIFVRNAFGNYRDILREVSYNPMMSNYLSYRRNRAFVSQGTFPDENYAREIMQLFSIGLWKVNEDGTDVLKGKEKVPTYTNEDIVNFARLWTGFDFQQGRGNYESNNGATTSNQIDPLQIKTGWRDYFPKKKLDTGFIGDEYPLCDDLPDHHWLTEGATYQFTGSVSAEGLIMDAEDPAGVGIRGRFTPSSTSSALYQLLCAPGSDGSCTFPSKVVLTENIPCDGQECNAGRVISAKIVDTVSGDINYYTYIPVPCVRLTFSNNSKIARNGGTLLCAPPQANIATPVCCEKDRPNRVINNYTGLCVFANEATNWETAASRCEEGGYAMCDETYGSSTNWLRTCSEGISQWINASCSVKVQVYLGGKVGIIDLNNTRYAHFKESSFNNFHVQWEDDKFPESENTICESESCTFVQTATEGTCVCDFWVEDNAVFTDNTKLPTMEKILEALHIGAPKPSSFGSGIYEKCTTKPCTSNEDITVWVLSGESAWDEHTIFELPPYRAGGRVRYLLNKDSFIHVDEMQFRNPPHFMPLLGELTYSREWTSDTLAIPRAEQETEAFLDHLFEHDNVAPFVAYRLIQRMVTSNPSPRYIKSVSVAFKTGVYGDMKFSERYGDLAAAVAAIVLDQEARSVIVEADNRHGLVREPLLKIVHMLRALKYQSHLGQEVALPDLADKIGMDSFNAPSVFGFYLPENRPAGRITDSGLVSPESQITTTPNMINFLNGMNSLVDNGLHSCDDGFGYWWHPDGRSCGSRKLETADGEFTYVPTGTAENIVDELDLLLTGGRLNETTREILIREYTTKLSESDETSAYKLVLKLFLYTSEFHTTNANMLDFEENEDESEGASEEEETEVRDFKAIVVIFEDGGCDSYNLIVPHSNCGTKDLYQEYLSVRQDAAIAKSNLLPIEVPTGTQPCNTFGVHPSMPNLKAMYDDKDVAFLANIGALVEPVSKEDYQKSSGVVKQFPPSLFAHNVMQRSMHNLHAQQSSAKGILARTVNAIRESDNYQSELYSLVGNIKMVEGSSAPFMLDRRNGVKRLEKYSELESMIGNITEFPSHSVFAQTFSVSLINSIEQSEHLGGLLEDVVLDTTFGTNSMSQQLQQVAKVIKLKDTLKAERNVFITRRGGFDTHNTFDLDPLFEDIDLGLSEFATEMKAQGVWDDVIVLSVSDFARTLTSNGQGTDHAWGGNHFIAGGGISGGRILGEYPTDLTENGPLIIGRGRVVPTSSWEAVWKGMVQWFGVQDANIDEVLPNLANYPSDQVWDEGKLFGAAPALQSSLICLIAFLALIH